MAPGAASYARVLIKRRRQIAQHRVGVSGHRHQVGGKGGFNDVLGELLQLSRLNSHMEGRADVEPHRESMQLCHDRAFETRAKELFAATENFGADESRDVIHDHPGAGLFTKISSDSVSSCFQRYPVDAFSGLIV